MDLQIDKSSVLIPVHGIQLKGNLSIPQHAKAIIVFAHGSGSSRLSPRNQMVADYLNDHGMATFLFDLLTFSEDKEYENRFNISLLSHRLVYVTNWLQCLDEIKTLPIGFFGASTGAAAAISASIEIPQVKAIVSRGGRPDLASEQLPQVTASTMLIIGGLDTDVIRLNAKAFNLINANKKLEIVPGASHLFSEPGTMAKVCKLANEWFEKQLINND